MNQQTIPGILEEKIDEPLIRIEDIPGLEIKDFIADYEITTRRMEGVDYYKGFHDYQTQITTKRTSSGLVDSNKPITIKGINNFNFEAAIETHYLHLKNLLIITR